MSIKGYNIYVYFIFTVSRFLLVFVMVSVILLILFNMGQLSINLLLVFPCLVSCPWGRLRLSCIWHRSARVCTIRCSAHCRHSGVAQMPGVSWHLSVVLVLTAHVVVLVAVIVLSGEPSLHSFIHCCTLQSLLCRSTCWILYKSCLLRSLVLVYMCTRPHHISWLLWNLFILICWWSLLLLRLASCVRKRDYIVLWAILLNLS